jgi:hypothetical protein
LTVGARRGDWEHDSELGSPRRGIDIDLAIIVGDEAVDDVETEAGALADGLGREERVEDPFADIGGDAGAVVDDSYDHPL